MINIFLNRVFRAIKIDIELFEEVEKDKNATFQAGAVVVLSSLAAGVGSIHLGASNFLVAPALSLLSWYVWAYVIYFVGVKLFGGVKTKSNHGELLRTIGFSSAPGLIRVFGITPELMTVTFINPGALEKPIVLKSSPWLLFVFNSTKKLYSNKINYIRPHIPA